MTAFRFHANAFRFDTLRNGLASRRRRPLLRVVLGLVGVALLLALVFVSVFVGITMLAAGVVFKLLRQRGKPIARDRQTVDGEFRVVGKTALPSA
jgi:hypothetical protein